MALFADGSFVARHNFEHYVDTVATLIESKRLLKPSGVLAVVPDEDRYTGRTLDLDPTQYHGYTESSLRRLVELLDLPVLTTRPVVPGWSFLLVAEGTPSA